MHVVKNEAKKIQTYKLNIYLLLAVTKTSKAFHCVSIIFLIQGFPELVDETECLVTFQFSTNEACATKPTATEIPCLIYNPKDKIKRDLSPLIKQTGKCQ